MLKIKSKLERQGVWVTHFTILDEPINSHGKSARDGRNKNIKEGFMTCCFRNRLEIIDRNWTSKLI